VNPFFAAWATPFGVPPFDRIRPEHFAPAFDAAMRDHLAEIDAIAESAEPPTFANTIEAMERSGRQFERVSNVFSNLNSSAGSETLREIDLAYAPLVAQHRMRVALNPGLFRRISSLYTQREKIGLEPDQLRLLERHHLNVIRNGAGLGEAEKIRMAEISQRLATLHTQFGQNVLHDEQSWHLALAAEDLAGLPDFVCAGAAEAAEARGFAGHVIPLSRSLIEPFLTFSSRRDLRRAAYLAWSSRGEHEGDHDNRKLIPEILALRAERARLLGYASYAAFRLADTMAGTPEAVAGLTEKVWAAGLRRAEAERDRLLAEAGADGLNGRLEPWDWLYYAEKVRRAEYAIDEAELKNYFSLDNMQRAAFDTATKLFGIEFVERTDIPLYHPDVHIYDVQEDGRHIGLFIADPYARADKRSGAWMSSYRDQEALDTPITPIIVNTNTFTRSSPPLLSYDDAETLFHEFGHALHGLLSQVRYPSQSGTSVRRDFVELPSQIYEHWFSAPETLRRYARHHETGEPIPERLIERLQAAATFNQGFATVEYTAAAILDMELHAHPNPAAIDIAAFERDLLTRLGMPPEIGVRHRPPHFQHLFAGSGYAAGYYSYLWAEVLDADGFMAFTEAGDLFDPAAAAGLKRILQAGDTVDPMALFIAFRGKPPSVDALLKHRGLVE
jgi:peptidyl-dipeptidase Dcp